MEKKERALAFFFYLPVLGDSCDPGKPRRNKKKSTSAAAASFLFVRYRREHSCVLRSLIGDQNLEISFKYANPDASRLFRLSRALHAAKIYIKSCGIPNSGTFSFLKGIL